MPPPRIVKLTRARALPNAGGHTLYFHYQQGKSGRFLKPHEVPDFEGDVGWFEIETVRGKARIVRQINKSDEPV